MGLVEQGRMRWRRRVDERLGCFLSSRVKADRDDLEALRV
jgi:hypothetical protein